MKNEYTVIISFMRMRQVEQYLAKHSEYSMDDFWFMPDGEKQLRVYKARNDVKTPSININHWIAPSLSGETK